MPEKQWKTILRLMPIPCVDIIVEKSATVLLGLRAIPPYKTVWALPGGRIRKDEYPQDTIGRILEEIRVSGDVEEFIGVFPIRFPSHPQMRYDITLCYRCSWRSGEPASNSELVRLRWFPPRNLPKRIGQNYRKMIHAAFQDKRKDRDLQER